MTGHSRHQPRDSAAPASHPGEAARPTRSRIGSRCLASLIACQLSASAWAHHPMGGTVPTNAVDGVLSGLGHPIIEFDHLLFLIAIAAASALARLPAARAAGLLGLYALLGMAGTSLRAPGWELPLSGLLVALSVLFAAICLWLGRLPGTATALILAGAAGLVHGYAYGEAIIGAEATPLVAYLIGLLIIQLALLLGTAALTRQLMARLPAWATALSRTAALMIGAASAWFVWTGLLA